MKQRVITAVVALCVLVPFLIFSDTFMLLIFSGGLSAIAIYELLNCMGLFKRLFISIPALLCSTAVIILTRVVGTEDIKRFFALAFIIFFTFIVYVFTVAVFSKGTLPITDAATCAAFTIYIVFGFASIILLRDLTHGKFIYLLAFIVPWMSDAFAYFVGVRFGKHKLIPEVSPKKTVEGAIGGIVFGTAAVVLYGYVIGHIFDATAKYPALIVAGLVMCILSQCGDLIASLVKRHYGIKDYGFVFPGHGGVLDRFDSIIATAPFLYILFMISPIFTIFF